MTSRRCKSFNFSRPEQSYIDACLADFAKKRIQKRYSANVEESCGEKDEDSISDKRQYWESLSSNLHVNVPGGLWIKPLSKTDEASRELPTRKVSFAESHLDKNNMNRYHTVSTRCPCCQNPILILSKSSQEERIDRRKHGSRSFSNSHSQPLDRDIREKRKSCSCLPAGKSSDLLNQATQKRKQTEEKGDRRKHGSQTFSNSHSQNLERNIREKRKSCSCLPAGKSSDLLNQTAQKRKETVKYRVRYDSFRCVFLGLGVGPILYYNIMKTR